jgi:hypothetical protein
MKGLAGMAELNLTNEDLTELIAILNIALSDANEQIRNSPDTETLNIHKDIVSASKSGFTG